jgi:hypothetical protein
MKEGYQNIQDGLKRNGKRKNEETRNEVLQVKYM